jgi:class 3 adenylate cyclase
VAEDMASDALPAPGAGADIRTFLFADMRGYTRFTQEQGDDAASALANRFADLVRMTVPEFEGELLELRGDEALCVFRSARQALRASVELQRRLRTSAHDEPAFALGVGMGLDAGEAVPTQGGYRGAALNRAARLCALAKPGEILATENVAHIAHRVDGLRLLEGRSATLKGMARPVRYVSVEPVTPLPPVATFGPAAPQRLRRRWSVAVAMAVAVLVILIFVALRSSNSNQSAAAGRLPKAGFIKVSAADDAPSVLTLRPRPAIVGDLGWAYGKLWMTTRQGLSRVNPETGVVDASVGLTGCTGCLGAPLATGLGRVFVTGGGEGSNNVQVIDPQRPSEVDRVIPTQPFRDHQGAFYVAAGFGSIWVWPSGYFGCCDGRMFWRLDPTTGRRLARWPAPNQPFDDFTDVAHAAAVGAGGAWFLRDGQLWRIDPDTNKALGGLRTQASMITIAAGAVWTITNTNVITEINPAFFPHSTAVIWSHKLPGLPADIAGGGGLISVLDVHAHSLIQINATSRQIRRVSLPRTGPGQLALGRGAVWLGYPAALP